MPVASFLLVTLLPGALLAAGALLGGPWCYVALFWLTVVNQSADALLPRAVVPARGRLVFTALPLALGLAHFPLLACAIWSLSLSDHSAAEQIALFLAFGLYFGSVSNAVAHELIHRTGRFSFDLGKWIFISHLFGHHTSAHRLIHHPYVATRFDPNSARLNESFYRFFARAWRGSLRAGLAAENNRRGLRPETRRLRPGHPYFTYVAGAAAFLVATGALAGAKGLLAYLGLAIMAQGGLLLTDYIQHYGLSRREGPDGRLEPVGPAHSWDAPHWFTRRLTLNAPLHAAHHRRPGRPYQELGLSEGAPRMPYGPGVMSAIALIPARWHRLMAPRARAQHRPPTEPAGRKPI